MIWVAPDNRVIDLVVLVALVNREIDRPTLADLVRLVIGLEASVGQALAID
jgi:hypothetical protein